MRAFVCVHTLFCVCTMASQLARLTIERVDVVVVAQVVSCVVVLVGVIVVRVFLNGGLLPRVGGMPP